MKNINHNLKGFLQKLPVSSNWKFWLILSLLIKSGIFLYKISEPSFESESYDGTFASSGGDTKSYIDPIENLLAQGSYYDDYRMPGYGWIYYLLRLVFSQSHALNALVLIQLFLSALSVYVLALLSYRVFKQPIYFYLSFFLYVISTYVSLYDYRLLTESFCTSAVLFSIYFLVTAGDKKGKLLLSGAFLTWAVFLRPVVAPVFLIFVIYVLLNGRKEKRGLQNYRWKFLLILIAPFLVIDGMWIIRNYRKYSEISPLTRTVYYPDTENTYLGPLFHFMNAFGGSIVYWNPGSDITFFIPPSDYIKTKVTVTLPSTIYTSKFNYDSLLVVRKEIQEIRNNDTSPERKRLLNQTVKLQLDSYTESIKKEKPFLYYVSSRLKVLKVFFIHSGTYNLFNKASFELNKLEFAVKLFYSAFYLFVVLFGFGGIIWMLKNGFKEMNYLLLIVTGLYFVLVFPFIFKLDEYRYFVIGYPFFIIASVYTLVNGYQLIYKKNT